MSNIIVLGAGMVGSAMAIDLSGNHRVTVADINQDALQKVKQKCKAVAVHELDVTSKLNLKQYIKNCDLVICAVPGYLGFESLKSVIEAGKNVVDISFFAEDALQLDSLAREYHVTAIVDCGVAPGMGNLILGHWNEKLKLTDFECVVGGLPKIKKWPFCYKAPFSPVDVIEEYTRPARFVQSGKIVVKEPLTDSEYLEFDKVGTLESFNSDGLRTILQTMSHIPNLKEKTLRYPGHVEYIRVLKESGFFSREKMKVNGVEISPLEFTSRVLIKAWELEEGEEEITVMRVTLNGVNENGQPEEIIYNLYDEYSPDTQTSSMARTTGYTATAAANMVLDGLFSEKGVFPPELVGKYETCFQYVISYLADRNIHYTRG
ncbi:MAG TPA: saccharopine dehydrogenase C-terminal domain-containing protein [Bacteroidales bacterium]|nr:saccharopine dehydrogenase C-terminal domain-containing protein [Bacteroidales bacterium]